MIGQVLEQYCNAEGFKYPSSSFVELCLNKGFPVIEDQLVNENPFCKIQPDTRLGSKMMTDLFQYIDNQVNNATIGHSETITPIIDICKNDGTPLTECKSLQRLLRLMKLYSHLDIDTNTEHQSQFIKHIKERYKEFLDDYIHLISKHSHQLESIKSLLEPCDIAHCKYTLRRHHEENAYMNTEDDSLRFYATTMDSIHFYLNHLFDVGLRVKTDKSKNESIKSAGSEFLRICAAVKAGREVTKSFKRFRSHSKFNFSIEHKGIYPFARFPVLI